MHTERLLHLAGLLDNVDPDHFDLKKWACGTTACAIGWACRDPWFNSLGLCLDREVVLAGSTPSYAGFTSWAAVSMFFDLRFGAARRLFHPDYYDKGVTPRDVAERIRSVIQMHS